jgi:hypothetical protein
VCRDARPSARRRTGLGPRRREPRGSRSERPCACGSPVRWRAWWGARGLRPARGPTGPGSWPHVAVTVGRGGGWAAARVCRRLGRAQARGHTAGSRRAHTGAPAARAHGPSRPGGAPQPGPTAAGLAPPLRRGTWGAVGVACGRGRAAGMLGVWTRLLPRGFPRRETGGPTWPRRLPRAQKGLRVLVRSPVPCRPLIPGRRLRGAAGPGQAISGGLSNYNLHTRARVPLGLRPGRDPFDQRARPGQALVFFRLL